MKFILQDDYKDMTLIRGDNNDYLLYSAKDDEDIFGFDNIFAESLALALLGDLGKGWRRYPEHKSELKEGYYMVTWAFVGGTQTHLGLEFYWHSNTETWQPTNVGAAPKEDIEVLAFYSGRYPAPFRPEEQ